MAPDGYRPTFEYGTASATTWQEVPYQPTRYITDPAIVRQRDAYKKALVAIAAILGVGFDGAEAIVAEVKALKEQELAGGW
jgi:hypothetical protein